MTTVILWMELMAETGVAGVVARLWPSPGVTLIDVLMFQVILFIALRAALVTASCVFAWRREDRHAPLSVTARLKWWFCETLALLRFNALMLSEFRSTATVRAPAGKGAGRRTLLILLHGVYCNCGIWRPMIRYLHAQHPGLDVMAPNLGPAYAGLEIQAQNFARWLDVSLRSHDRLVIVGHSMGGLVARICIAGAMTQTRIDELICLGVPHRGSELAGVVPGAIGRDLHPGSNVLRGLTDAVQASVVPAVNIYSEHDNLVVPMRSGRLELMSNHAVHGVGHMSLVFSVAVWKTVLRELRAA